MPLFEVAIVELPTKKEAEEGAIERLVLGPKALIAADLQAAGIALVMQNQENGEKIKIDQSRMRVYARPFA